MSSFVYDLPQEYRHIIKYLAENGSGNITSIAEFTKKSESFPLDRWAVKRRLYGTNRFQGLIDSDYVFEKLENKHRFKKQERTFYLRSKGIIASFADTSIGHNVAFKKVIEFANSIGKGKNESKFVQEFIISQLKYFLAYQYIQGAQLTWQKNSWEMYYKFLSDSSFGIDIEIKDEKILSEFRKLFEEYVVLRAAFERIVGEIKDPMGNNLSLWMYLDHPRQSPLRSDLKMWDDFVYHWFISPFSQIPDSEEFRRMVRSRYHKFVADKHILSRIDVLETDLKKRLKSMDIPINF